MAKTRKVSDATSSASRRNAGLRSAGLLAAGCAIAAGALLSPEVGQAFSGGFDDRPVSLAARGTIGSFTPAAADPRLIAHIQSLSGKVASGDLRLFRFTPASSNGEKSRAVTVAVRINKSEAGIVTARGPAIVVSAPAGRNAPVKITPTAYNLGVARGYKSFAQSSFTLPTEIRPVSMPDLSAIERTRKPAELGDKPSRFNTRIALEESRRTGRDPGTLEGGGQSSVDVAGSYKLTRNIDVTAGVRYSRERDRIAPLTDNTRDNQAVYVGTQFRF